jgi:hypothetical protein
VGAVTGGALRRWWQRLWTSPQPSAPASPEPSAEPTPPPGPGPRRADGDDGEAARPAAPRRHTAPAAVDDPLREAHLGAVLQALAAGPLHRDALARRVDAGGWGPGRLDAVVDHGLATRVLVEDGDGAVRARYAD